MDAGKRIAGSFVGDHAAYLGGVHDHHLQEKRGKGNGTDDFEHGQPPKVLIDTGSR
ncbi:MAG TPA: hypothetical protein VJ385_12415 [Fibrobacteria bacterium]|nr:hypothetical protein [Fibrobacteria bacterium]